MPNRIRRYRLHYTRLTPTEAELWTSIEPDELTSTTQVRGRLTGPRCHYASTVEVAYQWREQSRRYETEGVPEISLRLHIPEPSLWDPESPFLYRASLELFQGRQEQESVEFSCGLCEFRLTPGGLRWNGRPLPVLGVGRDQLREDDAAALRAAGCNLILAPAARAGEVCREADRLGFLVLCRWPDLRGLEQLRQLVDHPSFLGCLLEQAVLDHPLVREVGFVPSDALGRMLTGIELSKAMGGPLPAGFDFVAGPEQLLSGLEQVHLPRLIQRKEALTLARASMGDPPPGAIGWLVD
jgi:Glycosyl hydrolases family 2